MSIFIEVLPDDGVISTPIAEQPWSNFLDSRRYEPGTVTGAGQPVGPTWMRDGVRDGGAPIPDRIAERLAGREFPTFDAFRGAFWKEVARDPELAGQFSAGNLREISNGRSPFAPPFQQVGGRERFEIDHITTIAHGGDVYNMDNLKIMTPAVHIEKTRHD